MWSQSFSPQVQHDTQVLILGSMPGRISLARAEYYAHPRNTFWPIMASLFGFDKAAPYGDRLATLNACKVGLWDVYAECYREGSLDADIVSDGAEFNDFVRLFAQYPHIHTVFFNGKTAEKVFCRQVLPGLLPDARLYYCLPSTSPAHAGVSYHDKLKAWSKVREVIRND